MYHGLKVIVWSIVFISNITTLKKTWNAYKESKDKMDLMELIAKIIVIPSSLILLIAEFV
jgi:hypothetical protein